MTDPITIPCLLTVEPKSGSRAAHFCLSVGGEKVFGEYEHLLPRHHLDIAAAIVKAYAKEVGKIGSSIE